MRARLIRPDGGMRARGGGLVSPAGGLLRPTYTAAAAPSTYTLAELTPADIAAITGKPAPALMWLGSDASGADELVVGTDDLVDVSAPPKQIYDAILDGDTTQFAHFADSMDAQASWVADIGAETVTIMLITRPTAYVNGRQLFGKRIGSGDYEGYELTVDGSGYLTWTCDTGAVLTARTIAAVHDTADPHVLLMTREYDADIQSIWSREGSSEGSRVAASLSNAQLFSIGQGRTGGNDQNFAAAMIWIGTDGDGFGEADRLAVAQALGYE